MDEKTLRALVSAGAVKRIRIIGDGALFHVEADTPNGSVPALTLKGTPKTWRTLDAAAKWVRALVWVVRRLNWPDGSPGRWD